jgi:hypothetical protein
MIVDAVMGVALLVAVGIALGVDLAALIAWLWGRR